MDEATAKREGHDTHAEPEAEVQEVAPRETFVTPTPDGESPVSSGVQESDGAEGTWFVLIPDSNTHLVSGGYSTEEIALNVAGKRIKDGYPYVYVGCITLKVMQSTYVMRLVERKPTITVKANEKGA